MKAHVRFTNAHTFADPQVLTWPFCLSSTSACTLSPLTCHNGRVGMLLTCSSSLGLATKQVLMFPLFTPSYRVQRLGDPLQSWSWSFLVARQLLTGDFGLWHHLCHPASVRFLSPTAPVRCFSLYILSPSALQRSLIG